MAISLNNMGQVIEITLISWDGVPLHIPKFQIYAIIPNPIFTSFHSKDGKRIPLIDVDQYHIPVLEPYGGFLDTPPNFAVVMSHHIQNEFSLYAYPADTIEDTYSISYAEWLSEQTN